MPAHVALRAAILALVCLAWHGPASANDAAILVQVGPAYVAQEAGGTSWTIGNGGIRFGVGLNSAGLLVVQGLEQPGSGTSWPVGESPDLSFAIQTRRLSPGQPGFPYRRAEADEYRGGVRLRVTFDDLVSRLRVTRVYLCYPTAPVIETWTTFEAVDGVASVSVGDLGVWQLSVGVTAINWVTGLKAGASDGGRFTRRRQVLSAQAPVRLGSTVRSSEQMVPTVWFEGPSGHFFGGLLWSGEWAMAAAGPETSGLTAVRMSLDRTTTTVRRGEPVDGPHGIFGITSPDETGVTLALQHYVTGGLRQGRPFPSLVTYNTWYAYGIKTDDETVRAEMEIAAALGVELFVLDAGWYPGGSDPSDFTTGLGTWTADTRRFPKGLRSLRDHAHGLGLKFGIWVEPERVATTTVGRAGLARERYLATTGGRYNTGVKNENAGDAQICLADTEAREWVMAQLVRFLDDVQPDYLKWDNNYWINCDRTSHGHGTQDGNFAHTKGLYNLLDRLRARYPDLIVENCAAGGNRLDLGILQYTDVAWMDDVSGPSAHVRHNLAGLGAVFPPAYLLSFVMDDPAEPIHGAADMSMYYRSRMPGVLGVSIRGAEFGDADREAMQREIELYKSMRSPAGHTVMLPLSGQAQASGRGGWDAVQWYVPDTGDVVVLAFAGSSADPTVTLRPFGLVASARYVVSVPRNRAVAQVSGRDLIDGGIRLRKLSFTAGYVLMLKKEQGVTVGSRK
ncbi:MAG: alpha-galactosidase [Vicinamibacterales bacterium]|nr:alpha-galactosidase [Vicinamibacterales bacterium]